MPDKLRTRSESAVEVIVSANGELEAEICRRTDGLYQISLFRRVLGEGEYEPDVYWSPVGREVIMTDSLERARTLALDELRSRMTQDP